MAEVRRGIAAGQRDGLPADAEEWGAGETADSGRVARGRADEVPAGLPGSDEPGAPHESRASDESREPGGDESGAPRESRTPDESPGPGWVESGAPHESRASDESREPGGDESGAPRESRTPDEPREPGGDERGIDELIEIAEEIPERLGLSEGLAAIRATAGGEGLSVTVNLHGMLVHLDIGESALELGPDALAAEISRLSAEAGTRALHQGLRAVRAGCVPAVAAAVEDALALGEEPETEPPAAPKPDHDAPRGSEPATRRPAPDGQDDEGFVLKPVKD
ncbi:hypothetical protein [Amycolatopsis circi]|uniref:hypothetical protein n=1 Tax=Amycolatopsis circi TaxID=871959 RepID=UPI001ABF9167|nr:hypothetical protein [Amycolatopsis circi]